MSKNFSLVRSAQGYPEPSGNMKKWSDLITAANIKVD
jgi:hypothetical protein